MITLTHRKGFVKQNKGAKFYKLIQAKGRLAKIRLIARSATTSASLAAARGAAKKGRNIPVRLKLKPQRVMSVAKGTTNILAKTVTGEKILK